MFGYHVYSIFSRDEIKLYAFQRNLRSKYALQSARQIAGRNMQQTNPNPPTPATPTELINPPVPLPQTNQTPAPTPTAAANVSDPGTTRSHLTVPFLSSYHVVM